jgi:hypothetical protein
MLRNRTSRSLHYEASPQRIGNNLEPMAEAKGIESKRFGLTDKAEVVEDQHGNKVYCLNGAEYEDFHKKLHIRELVEDQLLSDDRQTIVSADGKRNNVGPSYGISGGAKSSYDNGGIFSSPDKVKGTDRLAPAFGIANELTWNIVKSQGWEQFFYKDHADKEFNKLYLKCCNEIHPESKNIWPHLALKCYVHDHEYSTDVNRRLQEHFDHFDPPIVSTMSLGLTVWDTWFDPLLCRWITGILICAGRKSLFGLYNRIGLVEKSCKLIIKKYLAAPDHVRSPTVDTFCQAMEDYKVASCNYEQALHFNIPSDYIVQLRHGLKNRYNIMMSGYLAVEMIFGFPKSNNAHRFQVGAEAFVQKVLDAEGDVDGVLEGETFNQALSAALMKKYGSTHGTRSQWSSDDDKGNVKHKEDEDDDGGGGGAAIGCTRFQSCANNPVSNIADWNSL